MRPYCSVDDVGGSWIPYNGRRWLKYIIKPAIYALTALTIVGVIWYSWSKTFGAQDHLRECVAKNGYTIECLCKYEMERIPVAR